MQRQNLHEVTLCFDVHELLLPTDKQTYNQHFPDVPLAVQRAFEAHGVTGHTRLVSVFRALFFSFMPFRVFLCLFTPSEEPFELPLRCSSIDDVASMSFFFLLK